jgi:predicted outer membrane repeat protein
LNGGDEITSCTFINNTAGNFGGAIMVNGDSKVVSSTFKGNAGGIGDLPGGAVFVWSAALHK